MQAEGIKAGDRHDVYDGHGRVTGGWTAVADAEVSGSQVSILVKMHSERVRTLTYKAGEQVDLSWGAGGDLQRTVKYPPGTPEYASYREQLQAELAKFAAREAPYEHDWCPDCGCNVALSCVCSEPCPRH